MKPLEKKIILGADGKTMVWVYDGDDVRYQPTSTSVNYKYYFDSNGKRWKTRPYNQWSSLMARTKEGGKYQEKQPTYKGVKVADDLSDFDGWCNWANEQPCYMWVDDNGRLFHLDKDLKVKGNRVYSKTSVCFLPMSINSRLVGFDGFTFYTRQAFFKDVFDKYFEVLGEDALEVLMDMCKMDYTLSKEPRMSVDEWGRAVENRGHDLQTVNKLIGTLQWNDWNDLQQSIVCTNGRYAVSSTYESKKLVEGSFTDAKDATLAKLFAKSEKVLELKFEVENFKHYDKTEYLEYLDDIYIKLTDVIDKINSGTANLKKWVLVDY